MEWKTLLDSALEKFKEQYNVELDFTSYVDEDEYSYQEEYLIDGLIKSDVINFEVGGWFRVNRENGEISCILSVKIDGDPLENGKYIQGDYDHNDEKWHLYYDYI